MLFETFMQVWSPLAKLLKVMPQYHYSLCVFDHAGNDVCPRMVLPANPNKTQPFLESVYNGKHYLKFYYCDYKYVYQNNSNSSSDFCTVVPSYWFEESYKKKLKFLIRALIPIWYISKWTNDFWAQSLLPWVPYGIEAKTINNPLLDVYEECFFLALTCLF